MSTPLLHYKDEIFLKLESFNSTGSVKDRAAAQMIAKAEKNKTLITADWGAFSLSCACVCKSMGRNLECFLPKDAEEIFTRQIKALDCKIHFCKKNPRKKALEYLMENGEKCYFLDHSTDPEAPMSYCENLAEEIWTQTDGKVSAIVSGTETCACLMGTATGLKIKNPAILSAAGIIDKDFYGNCDPLGSSEPEFYIPQLRDFLIYSSLEDACKKQEELFAERGIECGIIGGACILAAERLRKEISGEIAVIIPSRYKTF